MSIHPSACIDAGAVLADGVEVGPYCIVGPNVVLESGVRLISHVSISGDTQIGAQTVLHPFVSLGGLPQDVKDKEGRGLLRVGARNTIRENVSFEIGTGDNATLVGDDGLFMVGAHIGHDCRIGNSVTMTNNATLGGSCDIDDYAILGGLCAVHQGTTVARYAFVSGCAPLGGNVIPFGIVNRDGWLSGLNVVGMKRAGFTRDDIRSLSRAYHLVFAGDGPSILARAEQCLEAGPETDLVAEMVDFVLSNRDRDRRLCTLKVR